MMVGIYYLRKTGIDRPRIIIYLGVMMRIGVFFHIYHEQVASDILDDLAHVKDEYRLFITHSKPLTWKLRRKIAKLKAPKNILFVENRGRDILPFLSMLKSRDADDIDVAVKIHTKRTNLPHFDTWSKMSYGPILDKDNFTRIAEEFSGDERLVILGVKENYKHGTKFSFNNTKITEKIVQSIYHENLPHHWGFFAGTMFWARKKYLADLLSIDNSVYRFEDEPIGDNGSVAHAVERIFGLLPIIHQGRVGTIDSLTYEIVNEREAGHPSSNPMIEDWRRIEAAWGANTKIHSAFIATKTAHKARRGLGHIIRKLLF